MRAGTLRRRWTIEQPSYGTTDALGEPAQTWSELATVWAAVLPESARELYRAQQVRSEVTHIVRMRYRSDVTHGMRLVRGSRVLNVVAVMNIEERDRELLLSCVEAA